MKKIESTLWLGCTRARHAQIGVNAVVNARGGMQQLNEQTQEDVELMRDARKVKDWKERRVRFYQFNSKHLRKAPQVQHLLSTYED
jgi:hypothetical protein